MWLVNTYHQTVNQVGTHLLVILIIESLHQGLIILILPLLRICFGYDLYNILSTEHERK